MLDGYEEDRSAQRVVPYLSHGTFTRLEIWLRGRDLNPRPLGYEPNELPDCSTPRHLLRPHSLTHGSVKKPTRCVGARANPAHAHAPRANHRAVFFSKSLNRSTPRSGTTLANICGVTVLGGLILVTSGVAVSLGLSRLALGEFFRLVRIDTTDRTASRPQDAAPR